jgi:hypothetical protein
MPFLSVPFLFVGALGGVCCLPSGEALLRGGLREGFFLDGALFVARLCSEGEALREVALLLRRCETLPG